MLTVLCIFQLPDYALCLTVKIAPVLRTGDTRVYRNAVWQCGRSIEVVNEAANDRDDLMQDFVSIITSFCARLYGQRQSRRKTEKIIAELKKDAGDA